MPTLRQTLSQLILGQTGGKNRVQIIELLKERAYNTNQLAEKLSLNYRTVKHHTDLLMKYNIIDTSKSSTYGHVFFLTSEMEKNLDYYNDVVKKLSEIAESPSFFKNIIEQMTDGIIIIDDTGKNLYWNKSAEEIFEYSRDEPVGNYITIFHDMDHFESMIRRIVKENELTDFRTKGISKSGKKLDLDVTIWDFKNEDNKIIGFCIVIRHVRGQKP
jgi:PAS domain S-box-containing protein